MTSKDDRVTRATPPRRRQQTMDGMWRCVSGVWIGCQPVCGCCYVGRSQCSFHTVVRYGRTAAAAQYCHTAGHTLESLQSASQPTVEYTRPLRVLCAPPHSSRTHSLTRSPTAPLLFLSSSKRSSAHPLRLLVLSFSLHCASPVPFLDRNLISRRPTRNGSRERRS